MWVGTGTVKKIKNVGVTIAYPVCCMNTEELGVQKKKKKGRGKKKKKKWCIQRQSNSSLCRTQKVKELKRIEMLVTVVGKINT